MGRYAIALGILIGSQLACGGARQSETPGTAPAPSGPPTHDVAVARASPRRSANTLLPEELSADDRSTLTVFQAIQKLRPRFLTGPGYSNDNAPNSPLVLYVDDVKMTGLDLLRQMRMTDVEKVQYMTGAEGTMRFGMGHDAGVILVTRRK